MVSIIKADCMYNPKVVGSNPTPATNENERHSFRAVPCLLMERGNQENPNNEIKQTDRAEDDSQTNSDRPLFPS
jgi:hypothetical protein